ncbi:MAG: hypothetical protein ACREEK_20510 [Bradyrhizobium sp.]
MYKVILSGLFMVAAASPASAMMASSSKTDASAGTLNVTGSFTEQRYAIEKRMADGKTYSELSAGDRSTVREALVRISLAIEQSGDVASLGPAQQAKVFNDQELVNTILTKASEDSRLVCERVEKIGSHRKTTLCLTVAERRRARENSEDTLRKVQSATPALKGD